MKEKMQECQALLRWVSSEAQYADGMTKPSARQLLTDSLRTHMFKLQADEDFVAANSRKFALSKAASKLGGLVHMIFISQIMPVTGSSLDDASWSSDAMRLLVTMVMSFLTGCFCVWMKLGLPQVLQHGGPIRRAQQVHDNSVQCEIEYEEMSQMAYKLYTEREDREKLEQSHQREIESLENLAKVMKDTSETNQQDAGKFLSDTIEGYELALTASKEECIELERQIYKVQDSLDRAKQANANMKEFHHHEIEFRKEVYAIRQATRFHLYDDCNILMQAKPTTMTVCNQCEERRKHETADLD